MKVEKIQYGLTGENGSEVSTVCCFLDDESFVGSARLMNDAIWSLFYDGLGLRRAKRGKLHCNEREKGCHVVSEVIWNGHTFRGVAQDEDSTKAKVKATARAVSSFLE